MFLSCGLYNAKKSTPANQPPLFIVYGEMNMGRMVWLARSQPNAHVSFLNNGVHVITIMFV